MPRGAAVYLEVLTQDLEGRSGPYELIRQHLEAARAYLLGSMPREYRFNLKLVKDLLPDIEDRDLRKRIAGFLRRQEASIAE